MAKEKKTEELKPEEQKEDINDLLPSGTPVEKPAKDAAPYDKVIEDARLAFHKRFKNGRVRSYIMMAVVMVMAVASVIFITQKAMGFRIAGWVLIGTAVVGMLIYYIVTRNSMPNATKEYIALVNKEINAHNFRDSKFTEVTNDKDEKLDLTDPVADSIYKDLNNIASRNVINGKYEGRTFRVADVGLYSGAGKQRKACFVGKYISYFNDLHFEGRYIITSKGEVPIDLPEDIEDLSVISEEDNLVIYGKANSKPFVDLGKEFINKIKQIKIEKPLLNLNVVVWGGHTSAYCSYDDVIMTLPFDKEFTKDANEKYLDDLIHILDAFHLLVKKEK